MRFLQRILGFVFGIIRVIIWTAGVLAIALVSLFFVSEQPVPRETLNHLLESLSSDSDVLDAHTASFGLRQGLVLHKVRLLPKGVVAPEWFTADELRLSGGIRPDKPPREWINTVIAHRINISALPLHPFGSNTTTHAVSSAPLVVPPMRFDLVDTSFLGMRFKRLQGFLHQEQGVIIVSNVKIEWSGEHGPEEASGSVRYDPASGLIEGQLAGSLLPERIYPLLHLLEARGVEDIARRFVFNSKAVDVDARFRISPPEARDELRLSVLISDCTYDGVPIRRASAVITADGSNDLTHVAVQNLVCERADGRLTGEMNIDTVASNLDFTAQSTLPAEPLLRIIRVNVSPAKYDITFPTPPQLTAAGRVPLDGDIDGIRITGTMNASNVVIRHVPLQNLICDFGIAGNTYALQNIRTTTAGGAITGNMTLVFPTNDDTQTTYRTSLKIEHLDAEAFAAQLGFSNRALGRANADLVLASSFGPNHARCLNGSGDCHLEKATLGRIPLFAGLTDYMASTVPGVDTLLNQSEASIPFIISNGVLQANNVLVEGGVFSITGKGTYSFPTDNIDFNVRASIFKQRTWLGRLVQIVTFPFSKLLLEFRVKGTLGAPTWEYRGVLERIVDTVSGSKKDTPP